MENFMEILINGFNFNDLGSYIQLATGQVTLDTLFGTFFEGLKTFYDTFLASFFQ